MKPIKKILLYGETPVAGLSGNFPFLKINVVIIQTDLLAAIYRMNELKSSFFNLAIVGVNIDPPPRT